MNSLNFAIRYSCFCVLSGILLPAAAAAGDVSVEIGIGIHPTRIDSPEVSLSNPIGIAEVSLPLNKSARIVLNHTSSISDYEDGHGFNSVQIRWKVK